LVTSSSIQVLWADNATNETRQEVAYRAAGQSGWVVSATAATRTDWTLRWLSSGATYSFSVRACNGQGCSAWSSPVTGTTGG
jgi:hypothetical protein